MPIQNVRLIERKLPPLDSRRRGLRLAVRSRPHGAPPTANPLYSGI
jgi:hypothetical protein